MNRTLTRRELHFLQETGWKRQRSSDRESKTGDENKKHVQDVRSRIQVLRDEHYRLEGKRCEMEWSCFDLIRVLFRDFNLERRGREEEQLFQKAFYENRKDRRSTARLGMIQSALQVARSYSDRLYERRETLREEKQSRFSDKIASQAQRARDHSRRLLTSLDVTHQIEMEKRDQALERLTLIEQRRASSDGGGVSAAVAV